MAALVLVFFREILLGKAWLWEDMLYYSYPVRNFAATSMAMGQMPLWNPYTFNGMPFFADIQTAVFYLPLTALVLFVRHGMLSFYWLELVVILHYVLAGSTMFFLSRSFGLRQIPSLFAGVAFMLSGFMITHAIHQQIITLVAWYPLVFLLFRKSLTERRWKWVFLSALVLGHSTLAGYPQLSLYLYFFLFAYFLFELASAYKGAALLSRPALLMVVKAGCIIVLSLGVAMIQLLPTNELADLSQRAQISYEKSTEGTLAWSQLLTLLFPKFFGTAGATGYSYWGPGTYWYYWETCMYQGILPLLLAALSVFLLRRNKYVAFLWGVAAFALLFALGNNFVLHKLFFDFVPGFSKFRNPARIGIFLTFAVSLLSAFSLHDLIYAERSAPDHRRRRNLLIALAGLGVIIWVLIISGGLSGLFQNPHGEQSFSFVKEEAHISLIILLASGASMIALLAYRRASHVLSLAAVLLLFLDMMNFGGNQNNARMDPSDYFHRSAAIVEFLKKQGETEIFRVNTRNADGMIMDRNQGMVDRLFLMEGYTPLVLQRAYAPYGKPEQTFDLLNVRYKTVSDQQAGTLSLSEVPSHFPRSFFLYQTHVVRSEDELAAYLKSPEFDHRTVAVLEDDLETPIAMPTVPPAWKTSISAYENNRITLNVETSHDGLLVLSEIFYPGWEAFVDGTATKIHPADYNLRCIEVAQGSHTVEFRFMPESYTRGRLITLATVILCIAGIFLPGITGLRRPPPDVQATP